MQRREYEDACRPNERTRATYLAENFEPLCASGQLRLLDGDCELASGVHGVVTPGHTPGHMSVLLESEGQFALLLADLATYAVHFERLGWMTAYDVEPLVTLGDQAPLAGMGAGAGCVALLSARSAATGWPPAQGRDGAGCAWRRSPSGRSRALPDRPGRSVCRVAPLLFSQLTCRSGDRARPRVRRRESVAGNCRVNHPAWRYQLMLAPSC